MAGQTCGGGGVVLAVVRDIGQRGASRSSEAAALLCLCLARSRAGSCQDRGAAGSGAPSSLGWGMRQEITIPPRRLWAFGAVALSPLLRNVALDALLSRRDGCGWA